MRSPTLTLATTLTAALLIGCGTESSPTAADLPLTLDHAKYVEAVNFEIESPCNGELIAFSGESINQVTVDGALDDPANLHYEFLSRTRATGTGSETGAIYTLNDIFHDSFDSPNIPAPHFTVSNHASTHVTSTFPELGFTVHFVFHGLAPADGEFKVTRDAESVVCKV
jgi:hypothetical protein